MRTVGGGVAVVCAVAGLTWVLGFPQNPFNATVLRAIADCAAVMTLGLAVVPLYDVPRYRSDLARRAAVPLILSSAVWVMAELTRQSLGAADAAGESVIGVTARTAFEFTFHTAAGRAGLVCFAAGVVCLAAAVWPASRTAGVIVAGAAAIGVAGRTLVGHVSVDSLGGIAITMHTLAAALWCGSLTALVLTVEHRGRWSRVLPQFSRVSLLCVAVLTLCGIAAAAVTVSSPAELLNTGYGRVLAAKILVTAALVLFAWRNRSWWVDAARTHRATAEVSLSRSRIELAGMAVALTLAAGLAVTG